MSLSSTLRRTVVWLLSGKPWPFFPRRYRAVIFKVDRIGDFVLATSAIRRLVEAHGTGNCLLVVSPHAASLARREFPGCAVLEIKGFPGRLLSDFAPQAARQRWLFSRISCERLICLRHQRAINHEVMLSWIRADRSYGIENDQRCLLEMEKGFSAYRFDEEVSRNLPANPRRNADDVCDELERNRILVERVLGRVVQAGEISPVLLSVKAKDEKPFVLVCPYGTQTIRSIPAKTLSAALGAVQKEADIPVRLAGSVDQRGQLETLRTDMTAAGIRDVSIAETASFDDFCAMIASASLVLTAESAGAHLAAALDRPAVVLIGGGHYGIFAPWKRSDRQVWLTHRIECFGCDWNCTKPEPFCITEVTAPVVADAALKLLQA